MKGSVKLRTSSLVLAFFCLPVLACAESKNNFFSDGGVEGGKVGDGGTTDGGKTSGVDCAAACAVFAERSDTCSDTDKCETSCKAGKKAATSAECESEWQALVDCAAGEGTGGKPPALTCDSKGAIKISSGCTSKKTALEECLTATTTETDSGPPPGSCTLKEPVDSDPTCNSCAEQNCCDDWNACSDSTPCTNFINCISACPTGTAGTTCVQGCQTSNSAGAAVFQTALTCTQGACATPCGF